MGGFSDFQESGGSGGGKMGQGDFVTSSASGPSLSIDLDSGFYQEITLTGNITNAISFTNTPGSGEGKSVIIDFVQDGSGSRTVNFGSILFDSGIGPTLTTTANRTDRIAFDFTNDGSGLITYGHVIGLDMT